MSSLTAEQFDAVVDAQDEEDDLADMSASQVAGVLRDRGHPLFREEERSKARKAASKPAKAASAIPDLDSGPALPARQEPQRQAKQLPAAPPPASVGIEGMEELDQTDLKIPELRLKQDQTRDDHETGIEDVENGHWFLTSDPEGAQPERAVVFLEIRPGRQFMLPYNSDENDDREDMLGELGLEDKVPEDVQVICSSSDRRKPDFRDDREWLPLNDSCGTCPQAQWQTVRGKRRKPNCGEVYRCMVVDVTGGDETPARMFIKGSGIRSMKSHITNLTLGCKRHQVGVYGMVAPLKSKYVKNKKGKFFVPMFGRPQPLPAEAVESYRALRQGLIATGEAE